MTRTTDIAKRGGTRKNPRKDGKLLTGRPASGPAKAKRRRASEPSAAGCAVASSEQQEVMACPYCMEIMLPPILQCTNGHVCCSACKPKLEGKCPSCGIVQQSMSRALYLEKMAETLRWPCKRQSAGCKEIRAYGALTTHAAKCRYRPYRCLDGSCDFTGDIPAMVAHLKNNHSACVSANGSTVEHEGEDDDFAEGLNHRK